MANQMTTSPEAAGVAFHRWAHTAIRCIHSAFMLTVGKAAVSRNVPGPDCGQMHDP